MVVELMCHYCGVSTVSGAKFRVKSNTRTIDHMTPKSRGGSTLGDNKTVACKHCNEEKGQLTYDEYRVVIAYRRGLVIAPSSSKKVFARERRCL